jgi:hypothetical protein
MEKQISVNMSVFNKMLSFNVDGKYYDISDQVPESVWNIGDRFFPLHPFKDWEMRTEIRKIFVKYFRENIDENLNENEVVF